MIYIYILDRAVNLEDSAASAVLLLEGDVLVKGIVEGLLHTGVVFGTECGEATHTQLIHQRCYLNIKENKIKIKIK